MIIISNFVIQPFIVTNMSDLNIVKHFVSFSTITILLFQLLIRFIRPIRNLQTIMLMLCFLLMFCVHTSLLQQP